MSTYNFQITVDDKAYAVQVTPFEENGATFYRVSANDSSSMTFGWHSGLQDYIVTGNIPDKIQEPLLTELSACVRAAAAKEMEARGGV